MIVQQSVSTYRPLGQFDLQAAERALDVLSEILLRARKGIRTEVYLEDATKARKFNPRLFAQTAKQSRNFGFLNERLTPKKIYAELVEDELGTYENRFAKLCLDLIEKEASLAYRSLRQNGSLETAIGPLRFSKWGNAEQAFSFASDFGELSIQMGAIRRLHEIAGLLSSSAFYSSIKPLSDDQVHPNNVLNYDPLYGSLYRLYLTTSYSQDDDVVLKRLLEDFRTRAKSISPSLPAVFVDGDFEFRVRRYDGKLELRVNNLVNGDSRKFGITLESGFIGPSMNIAFAGGSAAISLFQSNDYSSPIRLLGLNASDTGFCPLCGERLSSERNCPACHAHYQPYVKDGISRLWAPDLLFRLGGRKDA